jgi:hypothetical protein
VCELVGPEGGEGLLVFDDQEADARYVHRCGQAPSLMTRENAIKLSCKLRAIYI